MYLLAIILKNEKKLKKLVSIMIECGFYDSSVIDGEGIENLASTTAPIFSEIAIFFGQELVYNRVILAIAPDRESLLEFVKLCEKEKLDFNDEKTGKLIVLKGYGLDDIGQI